MSSEDIDSRLGKKCTKLATELFEVLHKKADNETSDDAMYVIMTTLKTLSVNILYFVSKHYEDPEIVTYFLDSVEEEINNLDEIDDAQAQAKEIISKLRSQ